MTKINKLEMKGFKSFAKKTELVFGNDFNCVLGPNGSGKSNILDSLCFVLGKGSSKAMRAEKTANLIYNGGKTKKPATQGEVAIYFCNKSRIFPGDEDEIKISRVIKPTGQSKYYINDKTSTKSQILDTLSVAKINPDGYNIILQGDVIRFTEMPTDNRRKIIEEIAGINQYEEKKHKAVLELNKVEEHLNGATIILKEKKTHLTELQKDRDQALKYKELNDQIRYNKASYIKIQMEKKEAVKEELTERKTKAQTSFEKYDSQIKAFKEENTAMKKELEDIQAEIEKRGEKEQITLSKDLENLRVEIAKNKERIKTCNNEIQRIGQRRGQLDNSQKELQEKIDSFEKQRKDIQLNKTSKEKEKAQVEGAIEKFKQKNKLGDDLEKIDGEVENIDVKSEELQKNIQGLREKQQELIREKDKLEFMIGTLEERITKVAELEKGHKGELEELKKKREAFKTATKQLTQLLNDDARIASQVSAIRKEVREQEEQLGRLQIRSESQKEVSMQNKAVEMILQKRKTFGGVHGTVASLGNVSSKHALALEVAAGARIQSIIVDDDSTAAKCIRYLKENKLGIATFLPLNKIREVQITESMKASAKKPGAIDLAINLVKYDHAYKKAFSYVLGSTLIVHDVASARSLGIGSGRMVTAQGDVMDASGAMQGGFRHKRKGIGFAEDELTKGIDKLSNEIATLRSDMAALMGKKESNEEEVHRLRSYKAELEGEIIKQEKSLHLGSDDLGSTIKDKEDMLAKSKLLETQIDDVQDEISDENRELAMFKVNRQQLKSKLMEMRNPTVLAELNTLEEKKRQLMQEIAELMTETKGIDMQVKSIFMPEQENISKILKQHDKETESFSGEIDALKEMITKQHEDIKGKEELEKKYYSQFKELFTRRKSLQVTVDKNDEKNEGLSEHARKAEHRLNTIGLEEARVNAEYAALSEDFAQYSDLEVKITKTEEDLKKEIRDFEKLQENLGSINMRALEIYEQVEVEYNKLVEKREKLGVEKDHVLAMMEEIEKKKKELFMNTYDIINQNFQNKFLSLSRKGNAYLELENPQNPFEGGVDIKVKLSGKKHMDIRGLSGGEKTMTALAFIFAIQEHEPGSFYILDEVDAALDKHNSEKLAQLVRSYCKDAQYIVISHNDGVISEADNLYGISMDDHGVSKITSLKV